jgi:assimilatory nitrate reductase catalytic subunit
MTRTGRSPRLSQHIAEPFVEIHPADAARHGIGDADIVRVETAMGAVLVRALITARQAYGSIFVPMHWNDQFSAQARVAALVPALTDPHSGQPASKHVAARISRLGALFHGFAVLRARPPTLTAAYWTSARCTAGWRIELAFLTPLDWSRLAATLFGRTDGTDIVACHDMTAGQYRFACFAGDRLVGALFIAPEPVAVSRNWAVDQLEATFADPRARLAVMAGRPGARTIERGATVCACFNVGSNQISSAIEDGCTTVEAIGQALQAGTSCGSCRSEIGTIIAARALPTS